LDFLEVLYSAFFILPSLLEMGCPALGVCGMVAFLKQPALPGEATQTKNKTENPSSPYPRALY
jgi:hypothetical protein